MEQSSAQSSDSKRRMAFETLRREVLLGKFDAREKFPSEGQLCRRFGMSRSTVRLALDELKKVGILETRPGSGTFLTPWAKNATGYLGLILPGYGSGEIFSPICAGISSAAAGEGYSLLFGNGVCADPEAGASQALGLARDYAERHVAGVILEPVERTHGNDAATRAILSLFEQKHIPVVLLDRDFVEPPDRSSYDLIGIDNVQAAYKMASYVISRGARSIRYFVRPDSAYTTRLRAQGVAAAAIEAGLRWSRSNVVVADPSSERAVKAAFARGSGPDAVVCANDTTAAELVKTLAQLGVNVPRDVMVTGFDDVRVASLVNPPLTTMRQPCEQIARIAVETLLQRVRNPSLPTRTISLPSDLVVRESTR